MKRIHRPNFEIFMPYQSVPIDASVLKYIHGELMNIVHNNHFIDQRLRVLDELGYQLFYYTPNECDIDFIWSRRYRIKPTYLIGDMNFCALSNDIALHRYLEQSYYIQVTSNRVKIPTRCDDLCTVFVEIPERKMKSLVRKLKLKKLDGH